MFEFVPQIIFEAAKIMLSAHDMRNGITVKSGDANFATKYDVEVEEYLRAAFAKALPEAVFIGEESGGKSDDSSLYLIIDPIDGTTNFIFDCRHSAISVGICRDKQVIYGAVYNPYNDHLYHACRGNGAFLTCNGKTVPIAVSNLPLEKCLVAFGTTPYRKNELGKKSFETAYKLFASSLDIHRSGSAALDLCDTACGKIGFFFEYSLSPWDFAASSIIIEEAGGIITQTDGSPISLNKPCSIIAGNPTAYAAGINIVE